MGLSSKKVKNSICLLLLSFTLILFCFEVSAQGPVYNYYYRVSFKDKGSKSVSDYSPEDLLSQRAITRRIKAGIAVPDIKDLPVSGNYIDQVRNMGLTLQCTSKWMNSAVFKTNGPVDIQSISGLEFVENVQTIKKPAGKSKFTDKLYIEPEVADLPAYDRQLTMLNGYPLRNSGLDGKGILIAVLDGGFSKTDLISSLAHLRQRKGIKATRDFVAGGEFVYGYSSHGTAVMSILAGRIPDFLEGTAPGADYLLLRTEDTASEFPIEEDFWAAGAEFADSAGADIISSSLGYFTFDDPEMNYTFSDMDGNTTFVTRAADIAASKGILVVASAGNERNKDWVRLIAPSDGDSVLCAGAVDGDNVISSFSSAGPSADRRIKPDNVALGVSMILQMNEQTLSRGSGTSFSCPVLSGFSACIMQALPAATNMEIITAFHEEGDRTNQPDSLYGYGIPDMVMVIKNLQEKLVYIPEEISVASPNPFFRDLEIIFRDPPERLKVEIISSSGRIVFSKEYKEYITRRLVITELQNADQGLYFVRVVTPKGTITHKVIKLNN